MPGKQENIPYYAVRKIISQKILKKINLPEASCDELSRDQNKSTKKDFKIFAYEKRLSASKMQAHSVFTVRRGIG